MNPIVAEKIEDSKLKVQRYLEIFGLEKLQEEYGIKVMREAESNLITLNYDMIESPKFNKICDECRCLILEEGTWNVISRAFDRFYNLGEGGSEIDECDFVHINLGKVDGKICDRLSTRIENFTIEEKLDGSIMSLYNYRGPWRVSTRKIMDADCSNDLGYNFKDMFFELANKYDLINKVKGCEEYTFIFELIGPNNKLITPYEEQDIVLIGARNKITMEELSVCRLDELATYFGVRRPKRYEQVINLLELVNEFPTLEEGVVLSWICNMHGFDNKILRLKVKNPKFVAISNMRSNGVISPKRVLKLVIENDYDEYLKYFPEDKKYFDMVLHHYNFSVNKIKKIYEKYKDLDSQKDFALAIKSEKLLSFELGILFQLRKDNLSVDEIRNLFKNFRLENLTKEMGLEYILNVFDKNC